MQKCDLFLTFLVSPFKTVYLIKAKTKIDMCVRVRSF